MEAAEYALKSKIPRVDEEERIRLQKIMETPLIRKGGFSKIGYSGTPKYHEIQNITKPYFLFFIKNEERVKVVLTRVEFMRDHLVLS